MRVIKELWRGNVCPQTDCRNSSPEIKQLMEYMTRHHDDLLKTMTDGQKEIFEYAFRLGARLTMEVQSDINE